jgi:AraC-like DNA-binding protein
MSSTTAPRMWECDINTYHADTTAISHSGLDLVIDNPAKYYHQKLSGLYRPKSQKHFEDGTSLDEAILRPSAHIGEHVIHYPQDCLTATGAKNSKRCAEFEEANPGKVCVKESDELCRWIHAIRCHKAARALLETDGTHQSTIVWHDEDYGVDRRARFDFLHKDGALIVDLKTTRTDASPQECASECTKWGYHRQAAFYRDAVAAMFGEYVQFFFVFVAKEAPYRVEVFELDDEFLEIGRKQNARGLKTYAECLKSGVWQPDTHGKATVLSAPSHLRYQHEWELDNG